ncbi:MAG TPA: spermidine/putrescine ABC transporter substrate-binding protein [Bdellovibrionota bacterium]|nr:spermidine/putrescine ABC transporter substrate-binding protein [Bdellovibrionota bacterium]
MMKFLVRTLYIILISLFFSFITQLPKIHFAKASEKSSLNIFVWGDFFPEETFCKFEKETGIQLNISHYTSNEELILKLEKTKGEGYDLVFPSDYGVTALREKGLLKPIDHTKLDFWARLEPYLLDRPFDPKNQFSIPYFWEVYGIAFEKEKPLPHSLAALFDGAHPIVMTADPVEAMDFAAHYLYGYKHTLTLEEEQEVLTLLKKQKSRVEAYTDDRIHYIVSSENCPAAIMRVSFFWKAYNELSHLEIHLPKEGLFTTIENVALAKGSKHEEAAYKFINFVYKAECMAAQLELSPLFPACRDALPLASFVTIPRYHEIFAEVQSRSDFFFTHYLIDPHRIRPFWVEVKL